MYIEKVQQNSSEHNAFEGILNNGKTENKTLLKTKLNKPWNTISLLASSR